MKAIRELPRESIEKIRFVLTDIDDTLTRNGKLEAAAFQAIWRLSQEGFSVIAVTGQPTGWCDCIARQWPVEAVIGENGAFAFYMNEGRLEEFTHPSIDPEKIHKEFKKIKSKVCSDVLYSRVAHDQSYRRYDIAFDFREEPPDLGYEAAEEIAEICRGFGAEAKISSIHVNAWFGRYDKLDMVLSYMNRFHGLNEDEVKRVTMFCGDSPNDEPMFAFLPNTCGVANIREFGGLLRFPPAYITTTKYGEGFAEFSQILLEKGVDEKRGM